MNFLAFTSKSEVFPTVVNLEVVECFDVVDNRRTGEKDLEILFVYGGKITIANIQAKDYAQLIKRLENA